MRRLTTVIGNAVALTLIVLFVGLIIFALVWQPSASRGAEKPMRSIFAPS